MPKNSSLNKSQIFGEIVARLLRSPGGMAVADLKKEFGISDRNYLYYLEDFKNIPAFQDNNGQPMLTEETEGDVKYLRLDPKCLEESWRSEYYASFFMASTLMSFLAGTGLSKPMQSQVRTLKSNYAMHPPGHLEKKFYSVNEMPKSYSGKENILQPLIYSVVNQHKVNITYKKRDETISHHRNFKPYTLLQYRFGLYIAGERESKRKGIFTLAVDRITAVKRLKEKYIYPADYSPAKHFSNDIGIIRGDKTYRVQLLFAPGMASLVRERKYHEGAALNELKDGAIRIAFTVSSLTQVVSWILSFGPLVKVEEPQELVEKVVEELNGAARQYRKTRKTAKPA